MKKQLVVLGLLATVLTGIMGLSNGGEAATTGKVGSSTSVTVTLNSNMFPGGRIKNPATKYAWAVLHLVDPNSTVKASIYDADTGKFLTSWIARAGDQLQFGNDHKRYKLTFAKKSQRINTNNWWFGSYSGCKLK